MDKQTIEEIINEYEIYKRGEKDIYPMHEYLILDLTELFNKGKDGYAVHMDDLNYMWSNVR